MDMELEEYLRPPETLLAPYSAKVITLATSTKTVVRQVDRDAVTSPRRYPMSKRSSLTWRPLLWMERLNPTAST